MIPLQKAYKR